MLVMKVVERGVIDLDTPLQDYVEQPLWQNQALSPPTRRPVMDTGFAATIAVASILLSLSPGSAQPPGCLTYEPDTVRLTGVLREQTFPGRPNFTSIEQGDEPETGLYLHLLAPVCTTGDTLMPDEYPHENVRIVQVNVDSTGYAALRTLLGRRVTMIGTLYSAHTGHHHAPLILSVDRWSTEAGDERRRPDSEASRSSGTPTLSRTAPRK